VLQSTPDAPSAHRGLGLAYKKTGRFKEAVDPLRRASRQTPSDAQLQFDLGECLYRSGDWNSAQDVYKALKLMNRPLADKLFDLINV
jgi:Flp pilus assembly protein TadD